MLRPAVWWIPAWLFAGACSGHVLDADSGVGGSASAGAAGAVASAGASGSSGGAAVAAGGAGSAAGAGGATGCEVVTERRLRRVSAAEYALAVTELTGSPPLSLAPVDPTVHGFDNYADALSITAGNFEDYAISAELSAAALDVEALAPCAGGESPAACARDFIAAFATQAFGRGVTASELEVLTGLFAQASAVEGYAAGVRLAAQAVLLSPHFLYRSELGAQPADESLSAIELSNALSFALTGRRPDAPLQALAARDDGSLFSSEVLRVEARRLIATDAGRTQLTRFLRSLFGVVDMRLVNKEPAQFPMITPAVKADLDREIGAFLQHALGAGGGTLNAVLGASSTFMNKNLFDVIYAGDYVGAALPPVLPVSGEFIEVPLNPRIRRGLLGLAGWQSAHSPVHRTSPVDRSVSLRGRLLCASMNPPLGATFSPPPPGDAVATTREKFAAHTQDPNCQVCHRLIDPLGFGLEMIDTLGRYRELENQLPIDSSGALLGTDVDGPFNGPAELAARLMQSRQARDCVATQLFRFIEGRDEQAGDACVLQRLRVFFADERRTFADLFVEAVLQPSFAKRRQER